ncbi:MAG: hypothetical protein NTV94_07515 [Planctomycetota bacterium]|nr:hypothetical protein [Planctomycetota bacterium]
MSGHVSIPIDILNPGQFFACCGLLELASRLWPSAVGCFEGSHFSLKADEAGTDLFAEFIGKLQSCELSQEDADESADDEGEDSPAPPLILGSEFRLRLDWYANKELKTWAGRMDARVIFDAMRSSIDPARVDCFNDLRVVYGVADAKSGKKPQKREPFYFDSRRGMAAKPVDVGFSPDPLELKSAACPAVEALCLIGLQRFRPRPTAFRRVFDYFAWSVPLPVLLAAAGACGSLPGVKAEGYRFESGFRTDQRKHKGFLASRQLSQVSGDSA